MVAGDDLKRVRVIQASDDETIEIQWRRRRYLVEPDRPPKPLRDEILIERHTAPPASVWDARKEPTSD